MQKDKKNLNGKINLILIKKIGKATNPIIISFSKSKIKNFLNNLYPFILIRTIMGNTIDLPKDIDISISIPTINYPDFIKISAKIKTSKVT